MKLQSINSFLWPRQQLYEHSLMLSSFSVASEDLITSKLSTTFSDIKSCSCHYCPCSHSTFL